MSGGGRSLFPPGPECPYLPSTNGSRGWGSRRDGGGVSASVVCFSNHSPSAGQGLQHQVQGYVIMKRSGGILLAILDLRIIDEEALVQYLVTEVEGQEALIGPYKLFQGLLTGESGHLVLAEDLGGVLVMDMSLPGAAGMNQPFSDDVDLDLVNGFAAFDFQGHPDFPRSFGPNQGMASHWAWGKDCLLLCRGGGRTSHTRAKDNTASDSGSSGPGKAPAWAKAFKQEAHSCYPGRSVGCGLEFIAGHHRTTDPVDVEAGCHGEAGGKPADRCSSFSDPWEWEVINAHFVPLAGGSPYTPAPFSFLRAFFLVVVHLKHQLISSPFLLSFSWWWFTLKDQLLSSTFLLSSSWWWFTLNTSSFLLLFCFLLLGGGSP